MLQQRRCHHQLRRVMWRGQLSLLWRLSQWQQRRTMTRASSRRSSWPPEDKQLAGRHVCAAAAWLLGVAACVPCTCMLVAAVDSRTPPSMTYAEKEECVRLVVKEKLTERAVASTSPHRPSRAAVGRWVREWRMLPQTEQLSWQWGDVTGRSPSALHALWQPRGRPFDHHPTLVKQLVHDVIYAAQAAASVADQHTVDLAIHKAKMRTTAARQKLGKKRGGDEPAAPLRNLVRVICFCYRLTARLTVSCNSFCRSTVLLRQTGTLRAGK